MVKRALLIVLLAFLTLHVAHGEEVCPEQEEYEPSMCPLRLPPIVRVVIKENAVKSPLETDPEVDCSRFILTDRLVRRYLTRAKSVPAWTHHSLITWAACNAGGTVHFKDGRSAEWYISQGRFGSLAFKGQPGITMYCPQCEDLPQHWRRGY